MVPLTLSVTLSVLIYCNFQIYTVRVKKNTVGFCFWIYTVHLVRFIVSSVINDVRFFVISVTRGSSLLALGLTQGTMKQFSAWLSQLLFIDVANNKSLIKYLNWMNQHRGALRFLTFNLIFSSFFLLIIQICYRDRVRNTPQLLLFLNNKYLNCQEPKRANAWIMI